MSNQISIHALLAESDNATQQTKTKANEFLSTLSLRRATLFRVLQICLPRDFYPRSPCGERRYWPCVFVVGRAISIHALLAESDYILVNTFQKFFKFLSTLSLRRATANGCATVPNFRYFYPRSPCGERHTRGSEKMELNNFYPRSPCGERRHHQP